MVLEGTKKINTKIKEEPDISVKRVTKIVNGGQTDIERREELYKKCCEKIKE